MPNSARATRKTPNVGANADATANTEKLTTFSISIGLRPNRSASRPNTSAPTGRISSVQKMLRAADSRLR